MKHFIIDKIIKKILIQEKIQVISIPSALFDLNPLKAQATPTKPSQVMTQVCKIFNPK